MADALTPSVSEEVYTKMEGLVEHEILAGTYEAYLLAYRIGEYEFSGSPLSIIAVFW